MVVGKLVLVSLVLLLLHAIMADKCEFKARNEDEAEGTRVVPREADGPAESSHMTREAEAPEMRRLGKHHLSDKSMAAGGVIIGGLLTSVFAAVFAYIRVTRKRDGIKP